MKAPFVGQDSDDASLFLERPVQLAKDVLGELAERGEFRDLCLLLATEAGPPEDAGAPEL